jgi:hypothetical protein
MHELRFGVFALLPLLPVAASAQESDQSLAEQLANPISSLISVPSSTTSIAATARAGERHTLNIQPIHNFSEGAHRTI